MQQHCTELRYCRCRKNCGPSDRMSHDNCLLVWEKYFCCEVTKSRLDCTRTVLGKAETRQQTSCHSGHRMMMSSIVCTCCYWVVLQHSCSFSSSSFALLKEKTAKKIRHYTIRLITYCLTLVCTSFWLVAIMLPRVSD